MAQQAGGTSARGPRPFVGDRGLIDDIVRDVTRGESVVVRGPSGAGRSRLLAEVAAVLAARRRWYVIDLADVPEAEIPSSGHRVGILDDLHRAGAGADALARWVLDGSGPVVATAPANRPWPQAALDWIDTSGAGVFDLAPLSPSSCAELAEAACGRPLCSGALSTLVRFSSGLPQHLLELVDNGRARHTLDRGVDFAGFVSLPTPTAHLRARLSARLESLPADVRRDAEVLAALGPVSMSTAEDVVGLDALERLEAHGLLSPGNGSVEIWPYLLQRPLLDGIGAIRRRRILHVAEALPSGDHLVHARVRLGAPDRATTPVAPVMDAAVMDAARRSAETGDPWEAAELLETLPASSRTAEVELLLGRTLADIGLLNDAATAFRSAAAMPDSLVSTPACVGLARLDFARGDSAEADRRLADGDARTSTRDESIEIATARVEFRLFDGRWDDVVSDADSLAGMAADGPVHDAALVFAGLGRCMTGPIDAVATTLPPARNRPPSIDCWWRFADYTALLMAGDLDGACESATEGARSARDGTAGRYTGMLLGIESAALSWRGDISGALTVLHDSLPALEQDDPAGFRSIMLPFGSYLHAFAGDRHGAMEVFDRYQRGSAAARRAGNAQRAQLWIAALSADEQAAAAVLDDVGTTGVELAPGWALVALHDAVRLGIHHLAPTGSLETAASCLGGPLAQAMTTHARGIVDADAATIAQAASSFAAMGFHLHAAEAWEHCLRTDPDSDVARLARHGRATALESCHGARTPALTPGEAALLTRREQQVANLAADGLANRAIAEHLGLSVRTVENHLQRACGKLGTSGRVGLSDALAGVGRQSF